ncbi:MAG: DNA/RNA non-specific endonuclease [Pseudomonadota bacterium]
MRQIDILRKKSGAFEKALERAADTLPQYQREPALEGMAPPSLKETPAFDAVRRGTMERLPDAEDFRTGAALEAIILADLRPAYFVQDDKIQITGNYDRVDLLEARKAEMEALCRRVGRVDLFNHRMEFVGTGWLIDTDVVVTNRHVAEVFTRPAWPSGWDFVAGDFGRQVRVEIDTLRQHQTAQSRLGMRVIEVLHVNGAREPDIAFLKVQPEAGLEPIPLAAKPPAEDTPVAAVGYPAADPRRNDPVLMNDIFGGTYDVKRFSPGLATGFEEGGVIMLTDYTTLGGNSGSVVLDIETGEAVGLHFAGLFGETNFAVSADIVAAALRRLKTQVPGGLFLDEGATEKTPAAALEGREGYDPAFLGEGALRVDLPCIGAAAADDLAPVKGASDGILRYTHFSVLMSSTRRLPILTAVNIDGAKAFRLKRKGSWNTDGRIADDHQIDNVLYKHNPLDRGHLVRRKDPGWGATREEAQQGELDTFHYTNCAPQHKDLNQRDWVGLEDYILEAAETKDFRVSVMTGPVFREDDRRLKVQPGAEDIRIPEAFWKIAVMVREDTGALSATAYLLTQGEMIRDLVEAAFVLGEYKTYQVKVSRIAALTGFDFSALEPHDPLRAEPERLFGRAARPLEGAASLTL